jgi:type VI secretion system secreted protein VgrG
MPAGEAQFDCDLDLECDHGQLLVHAVRGRERLSAPFVYEIDFSTDTLDLDAAPRAGVRANIRDGFGRERPIAGVIEELEVTAGADGWLRCRIKVTPFLSLLAHGRDCRIFQEQAVPDIVRAVFTAQGVDSKRYRLNLRRPHGARLYCVQYDESPWDFVNRLLEEEGIYYWFEHSADDGDVMVMTDDKGTAPKAEPDMLPFHLDAQLHGSELRIWDVDVQAQAAVSKVTLDDYNMITGQDLASTKEQGDLGVEWYEYPGRYDDPAVGKRLCQIRLEELQAGAATLAGATNAVSIAAGAVFSLEGHPASNGDFLVTATELTIRIEDQRAPGPLVDTGPSACELRVTALSSDAQFRPARRTARPLIPGLQTARVTGPEGSEIHCDAHGRVKVQFHWDREGDLDDKTSCWIRVAQAHTTGSIMIPRVGWEVLVQFEEGDPDRPLCMGRVYNPFFMPAYPLPARKTVSGHRSNTSPGGAGVNEVMFDDAAGSQLVAINGTTNVTIKAAHDKVAQVAKNESRVVTVNRKETVGTDAKIAVKGNQFQNVGGDQSVTVGATRAVKVGGKAAEETLGNLSLTVGAAESMQVGNPAQAILDVISTAAISAAEGAAATAASRAEAALLGPIAPALGAARHATAGAERFMGPAGSLLSHPGPMLLAAAGGPGGGAAALAAAGAATSGGGGMDAASVAAGAAGAVASGALGLVGVSPPAPAASGAGGGGGGGGSGAAGSGVWGVTIGKDATETIGALAATNAVGAITVSVGGSSTETVGAARIELVAGGKAEMTGGSKTETVGVYMVKAGESMSVDAMAAMLNIAGTQRQKIAGSHAMTAGAAAALTAGRVKLEAAEKITLKCGQAEVVIADEGVSFQGMDVEIEGTAKLELTPPAITTP